MTLGYEKIGRSLNSGICPNCGMILKSKVRVCPKCGEALLKKSYRITKDSSWKEDSEWERAKGKTEKKRR